MSLPEEKMEEGEAALGTKLDSCEDKQRSPSCTPENLPSDGSPVSDNTCPICLGTITDKCVANSCLHRFCLICLKEWAKQKPVCPLCKLRFTTIMYEIKSETEYKEWKVPRPEPAERTPSVPVNFEEFLGVERQRFFGYRTTNFPGAATLRRLHPRRSLAIPDAIPSGPREHRHSRYNLRGSSMFRLSVYLNNVWVQPIADVTGRYRQSAPDLYQEQPALTHRLIPWVNRELAALLPPARIADVLTQVIDLITRYPIDSREFRRAVRPHLGDRTNHFVHEFYHFARSPYDMVGHDSAAQYVPRYGFNDDDSSSSSDDSDAVVEVDMRGNPVTASASQDAHVNATASGNVVREETLTNEGSVVISSDENSSADGLDTAQQSNITRSSQSDYSETHNPEPPVHVNNIRRLLGRARNFLSTINDGASTSRSEGIPAAVTNVENSLKREIPSESEDSDACMIVDVVHKRQKTPEIINIESEEDGEPTTNQENHFKKSTKKTSDSNSSHQRVKKSKKKPSLKRTNFPLQCQPGCSGSSSRTTRDDHSYCNELESTKLEASTSSSSSGSVQTSSIEISLKWHKSSENKETNVNAKHKDESDSENISISSDSESSTESWRSSSSSKNRKHRSREKAKPRDSRGKRKHVSTHRFDKCSSSDRYREERHREKTSSPKRLKKDHRSKVKGSSSKSSLRQRKTENPGKYLSSDSSDTSPYNSDSLSAPLSRRTERSLSLEAYRSSEASGDSKVSYCSKHRGHHHKRSKSKISSKKKKRKTRERTKEEKSKRTRRSKHKKRDKSRRSHYSSSSSEDEIHNFKSPSKRSVTRRTRIKNSSSKSDSDSSEVSPRKRSWKSSRSFIVTSTSSSTDTGTLYQVDFSNLSS